MEMLEVFSDSGEKKSGREYKTKNRFDDISSIVWLFIGMENAGRLYPLLRSVTGVGSEGRGWALRGTRGESYLDIRSVHIILLYRGVTNPEKWVAGLGAILISRAKPPERLILEDFDSTSRQQGTRGLDTTQATSLLARKC